MIISINGAAPYLMQSTIILQLSKMMVLVMSYIIMGLTLREVADYSKITILMITS